MTTTTAHRTTFDFARYMNVRAANAPEFTPDGSGLIFLSTSRACHRCGHRVLRAAGRGN
ncbi:MAG: hypothetical protein ACRDJE_22660 [Dehalococcoidia bacterium]